MSKAHREWTDEERKAQARVVHAANRLTKLTSLINRKAEELKMLRAEQKQLRQVAKG